MLIKRKLYSYLEERDFGEVKRANKAAKRAELLKKIVGLYLKKRLMQ